MNREEEIWKKRTHILIFAMILLLEILDSTITITT
jgi:hypothetical protein